MNQAYQDFFDIAKDLQAGNLNEASVGSEIEVPSYPEIADMIDFMSANQGIKTTRINLKKLSVNGSVVDEPMEKYLASEHVPSSGLKEVLKNPASFFFYLNDRKIIYEPEKPHFALGTFAHMAILEPKLFKKVKVEPKCNLATTEGARALAKFYKKLNREKLVQLDDMPLKDLKTYIAYQKDLCKYQMIAEEHKVIIDIMKRNYEMYGGGIISKILKGAKKEVSFYGNDQETGLKVKIRPDAFNIAENIGVNAIISVKTTSATSVEKFISDTARYQYELSEGMYQNVATDITGRKFDVTIMIMLQTVAPYLPAIFWWSPDDLQNGKYKYRFAVDTASDCLDSGLYPGYESLAEQGNFGIINMKQPPWAQKLLKPVDLEN